MKPLVIEKILTPGLLLIGLLFIFTSIQGCATIKHPAVPLARIDGYKRPFFPGQIIEPKTGKVLNFEQLIERLASVDMVYVGEVHNNADHHLIQMQILQGLKDKWGPFALGLEAFPSKTQLVINEYLQDQLSESDFLRQVNWDKAWGFDYHFYRPLVLFQKQVGGEIIALNVPHRIVRKVARRGIQGLSPQERAFLPQQIHLGNKKHRKYISDAFEAHKPGNLKNFEYFYEAQCVWDESMAQNICNFFSSNPRKPMVVVAGDGHIVYRFGIPDRVTRRINLRTATVVPLQVDSQVLLKKDIADYVWLTGKYWVRGRDKKTGVRREE